MGRRLIYVPIIHQEVDVGSLSGALQRAYIARYGVKKWRQHRRAVDALWQRTRERIFSLGLDFRKVKLYQDGLPTCGNEREIVQALADSGSQNYRLLCDLVAAGSQVIGTEDPNLLLEEYHQLKTQSLVASRQSLEKQEKKVVTSDQRPSDQRPATSDQQLATSHRDQLMADRDAYIARRIDETLQNGEIGILFMGAMHRVDDRLSPDIEVSYLLPELKRLKGARGSEKLETGRTGSQAGHSCRKA